MAPASPKKQLVAGPALARAAGLDWGDLRFFLAMARTGSLSRAARNLGVDRNTVARRVAALEEALGLPLFERGPQGWTRTAGGDELAELASRVEEDVLALARHADAHDRELSGPVRLTATPLLASHLLAPALPLLRQRHPGIVLDIAADQRRLDLTRREADLAVRLARPRDSGLVTRRLAEMVYGLYALEGSAAAARGCPDFGRDVFLSYGASLADAPEEQWLDRHGPERKVVFRSNSTAALYTAVRRGVAVGLLPCFLGDADPALRRLEAPDPFSIEVWLLVHRDLRRIPRIRAVIEWLDEVVAQARPALGGRGPPAG